MRLERLKLWDYRNFERLDISFPGGIIVLAGPNGSGKSNLLEAIHYLSYLKSFRTAREREIIRHKCSLAAIEATFRDDAERPFDVRLVLRGQQRHLQFNGDNVTRFQDYIGRLHCQFFFPGNLSLITGDPSVRREVLDLELLRLKPALIPVYAAYRNALKERNRTLKLLYPRPGEKRHDSTSLDAALSAFSDQLVSSGTLIIRERIGLVNVLGALFQPVYSQLAPPKGESVELSYNTAIAAGSDGKLESGFRQRLVDAAQSESQLRYTSVGPHRDDLLFMLDGSQDLRRFGSQGQMRSSALGFRLALCALSARRLSDDPVTLLDDALAELDDDRKERLLGICRKHRQVFITSASQREIELISPQAQAVYDVRKGVVTQRQP